MGFLDKIKNMFTEEVDDEVKVEQIKKEVTHVQIETPKVSDFEISEEIDDISDNHLSKPVFFDDNDFKDLNITEEVDDYKDVDNKLYGMSKEEPVVEEKKSI